MSTSEERIVGNIMQIRTQRGIKQFAVADAIGLDASTYSKIEKGTLGLSIDKLAKIASYFEMTMIDVITYPKRYVDVETLAESEKNRQKPKVIVQVELEEDKKEQVLKILFAEHALSIVGDANKSMRAS